MSEVFQTIIRDIRFGARQLGRNLPLTVAALLCFALGVGANTSIFSVVNAVLFRPLPFPESDQLVMVSEGISNIAADINRISAADLLDYKETEGRAFESLALIQSRSPTIVVNGDAQVIKGASITPSAFKVLRVRPAIGRAFLDSDTATSAPLVVIISDALWRRWYGADRSMVGKQITFSGGFTAEVVGIMSPGFAFPLPGLGMPVADIFFPFRFSQAVMNQRADNFNTFAFGRLRNGVSMARGEASLADIMRQMPERYPESWGKARSRGGNLLIHVKSLRAAAVGESRRPLLVLLGAVGFVLLIACINVASLFVARASARKREIAIRTALGASRGRLTQQFLVESLLLLTADRCSASSRRTGAPGRWSRSPRATSIRRSIPPSTRECSQSPADSRYSPPWCSRSSRACPAVRRAPTGRCARRDGRLRQTARASMVGACSS